VSEPEAKPAVPVLQNERINVDLLEVARQEGVNLEIVQNSLHRNNLDLESELDDLFDRYRKRTLLVELRQELFSARRRRSSYDRTAGRKAMDHAFRTAE
jgi:hypothetical protein